MPKTLPKSRPAVGSLWPTDDAAQNAKATRKIKAAFEQGSQELTWRRSGLTTNPFSGEPLSVRLDGKTHRAYLGLEENISGIPTFVAVLEKKQGDAWFISSPLELSEEHETESAKATPGTHWDNHSME
jgi:hypothetical protein